MRFTPRRSSPRLPSFDYVGEHSYHLVFNTRRRCPRFSDASIATTCLHLLEASSARYGVQIPAYCFMPDHLHLLVVGADSAPLYRFAQHFKQATGYRHQGLWQRSFYDHILRSEEAEEAVAFYIWENPVRAGLADTILDYPHSGPRESMLGYSVSEHPQDRAKALSLHSLTVGSQSLQEVPAWKH